MPSTPIVSPTTAQVPVANNNTLSQPVSVSPPLAQQIGATTPPESEQPTTRNLSMAQTQSDSTDKSEITSPSRLHSTEASDSQTPDDTIYIDRDGNLKTQYKEA